MFCSLTGISSKSVSSFLLALLFCLLLPGALYAQGNVAELIVTNPGQRSWLGLTTRELDEFTARMLAIDPGEFKGLVVIDVVRGGPADEAGIVRGDVLLSIDDKEIPGYEEFKAAIRELDVGSTLKVLVDKGGTLKDVLITLGSMRGFTGTGEGGSVAMKDFVAPSDELHTYYWMKEAQQYDYIYSFAMGALDLTPKQRRDARSLMSGYEKKMLRLTADINIEEVELREHLAKEPVDLRLVRKKIVEIAAKRTELRYKRIKAHAAFKRLLTKKQQRLLKEFMSVRQGRGRSISD